MNAGLIILRVVSERRDAPNERDRAGLRSSVAAATPLQLSAAALQPSTQLVELVASLLEVLLFFAAAAPRGGTRAARSMQHQLRRTAASAPSQQQK